MGTRLSPVLVIAAVSCASEPDMVTTSFARETFCPDARVHAAPAPLALARSLAMLPHVAPWLEPVAPPAIASDAERMKLWTARRDAEYAAWERKRDLADPRTNPTLARDGTPIFEVTGCGSARLYACYSGRHASYCTPLQLSAMTYLVCQNNGAIHVTGDGAIACTAGEPPVDQYACATACPQDSDCASGCGSDASCALTCGADAARCRLDCATSAREQCDASGLGLFGACTQLADEERSARDVANRIGDAAAQFAQMATRRKRLDSAIAELETCSRACRGAGSPRPIATCLLECATRARAQCEGDEPHTSWCDGLRSGEQALQQQLGQ
jgi:hypothetical protein